MSGDEPLFSVPHKDKFGIPRVSGDEPLLAFIIINLDQYSPRERG